VKVEYKNSAKKIAEICNGKIISGSDDKIVSFITTNSRKSDKNGLFVALEGEKFDGHDYITQLSVDDKVSVVLIMNENFAKNYPSDVTVILCSNTLQALAKIATAYRSLFSPTVVGITGTNGKTTTKEIISHILSAKNNILKSEKNYNNEIGLPFTILNLKESHEVAVIEMGMNHSGEIKRLTNIAKPDIAVITNTGEGHLEFLGSVENVAKAKSEIFDGMKKGSFVVLNRDSVNFNIMHETALMKELQVKTFGFSDNADFYPESYKLGADFVSIVYQKETIVLPMYGIHNISNLLASIAVSTLMGFSAKEIESQMKDFKNISGRSEIIDCGYLVVNDTYNSNPLSVKAALESISATFKDRRKIAILSDMKELGVDEKKFHIKAGEQVFENGFESLFLYGDFCNEYKKGAVESGMDLTKIFIFEDKNKMINFLKNYIKKNDIMLVKGSRSMKMEEIVNKISVRN